MNNKPAILISIQPKWCEMIANGEKTIEVRKTRPKIETPFKCYIYCTNGQMLFNGKKYVPRWEDKLVLANPSNTANVSVSSVPFINRKVIGEFICDNIIKILPYWETNKDADGKKKDEYGKGIDALNNSCMSNDEIAAYGKGETLYGWHISELKLYNEPKELVEFYKGCNRNANCYYCRKAEFYGGKCIGIVIRPPTSYMYVEKSYMYVEPLEIE